MDSTAPTALVGSKIIFENCVAAEPEYINETASTVEKWIRQRIQLLWTKKS
jgi:hypothetical protein